MERLIDLLMTLLPPGGLGLLLGWVVSARVRRARTDKETSDIYQGLYNGLSETVTRQNEQISKQQEQILSLQEKSLLLHRQYTHLLQVVNQARVCRYWGSSCPIRRQLQDAERGEGRELQSSARYSVPRQHTPQDYQQDEQAKPARGDGTDAYPDVEPP